MKQNPWTALRAIGEHIRRLRFRLDAVVTRGVVELVNDRLKTQRVQLTILEGEVTPGDVEHMQPYGLSFAPPVGAECIALAPSGSRAHTVAICVQHPEERPKGAQPREGGLYTKGQWRLFIDQDGLVHLGAQKGASPVALASKVDAELQRIWDLLTVTWKPTGSLADASALQLAAVDGVGAVQSTAAQKTRAT